MLGVFEGSRPINLLSRRTAPRRGEKLLGAGIPGHVVKHLSVMTEMNKQGRYDRMTDDLFKLTGRKPISVYEFVKLHEADFAGQSKLKPNGHFDPARVNSHGVRILSVMQRQRQRQPRCGIRQRWRRARASPLQGV